MPMHAPSYGVTDQDRAFCERELASFVPDRIFDAHVHLGLRSDYPDLHRTLMANTPQVADMPTYRDQMQWIAPGRNVAGALVLPTTLCGEHMAEGNAFVAREARTDDVSFSSPAITPRSDASVQFTPSVVS